MTFETIILGASERLDFLLPLPVRGESNSPAAILRDLLALTDRRLKLRIIISTEKHPAMAGQTFVSGDIAALADNWYELHRYDDISELAFATHTSKLGLVIADDEQAIVVDTPSYPSKPRILIADSLDEVTPIKRYFDHLWSTYGLRRPLEHVLYENLLRSSFQDIESRIVTLSKEQWARVIKELNREPDKIFKMSPREFEQLIAHLLERQGYAVSITPQTRDGGKDILIATPTTLGDLLYLVECKRYSPSNPVGVSLVRELYGVVEHERATAGIMVTSSSFTTDALLFREPIKHRMTLHDYKKIQEWIRNTIRVS